MQRLRSLLAVLAFAASFVAFATPITFIHTGVGSGNLAGAAFNGAGFTITATGDTGDRVQDGDVFWIDHLTAQIDIDGLGVLTFVTGTRTFVNQGSEIVGFSRAGTGGLDLYNGPLDALFGAWDMTTSIGPILGSSSLLQWLSGPVTTSGGVLAFDNAQTRGTFQAIVGRQVPEPGTLVLAAVGVLALGLARRRRAD